jgi:hypothetical protein
MESSFHSPTANWTPASSIICHLRNSQSSFLLPLPTISLPSLLKYLRRPQLSTDCSRGTPELCGLFSTELLFITTLHGPNRKHRFQEYFYCVFTDPSLRNGFFCCFLSVRFHGNCLPSRCIAVNYSGFQASCHNIKMDLRETGWGGMDWIDLAEDRDRWRALVNTAVNLRVPRNIMKFLSGWATGGFPGRIHPHGIS